MGNFLTKYGLLLSCVSFNAVTGPWFFMGPKLGMGLSKPSEMQSFERWAHIPSVLGFFAFYQYLNSVGANDPWKKKVGAVETLKWYAAGVMLRHALELVHHEVVQVNYVSVNALWTGLQLIFLGVMTLQNPKLLSWILESSWMISVPILSDLMGTVLCFSTSVVFGDYPSNLLF
jgi:hypothetical protein